MIWLHSCIYDLVVNVVYKPAFPLDGPPPSKLAKNSTNNSFGYVVAFTSGSDSIASDQATSFGYRVALYSHPENDARAGSRSNHGHTIRSTNPWLSPAAKFGMYIFLCNPIWSTETEHECENNPESCNPAECAWRFVYTIAEYVFYEDCTCKIFRR